MSYPTLLRSASLALLLAAAPVLAERAAAGPGDAYAKNVTGVGGRAVDLMKEIPEASYGWQPMEGVRSTAAAAMHMASANYYFASRLGTAVPEGIDMRAMQAITDKDEVVRTLEASIAHLAAAFKAVDDATAEADIFGDPGTVEDLMMVAIGHVHEHFGQLIAYARANRVVPPWSQ